MAPQNISIGVRGHLRSNLRKAFLLDALCFRPRIFGKKSASRSPQHHKESPQRINRKIQLKWEQNRNVVSALMPFGPGWRGKSRTGQTGQGGFVLEGVREDNTATWKRDRILGNVSSFGVGGPPCQDPFSLLLWTDSTRLSVCCGFTSPLCKRGLAKSQTETLP